MTRIGWAVLLLIVAGAVCFGLLARFGGVAPLRPATSAPPQTAALAVPVANVPRAQLVDSFDDPRPGGRRHGAIDILAGKGTPVLAAADGRVEKLFDSARGGHTIYVRSPDGGTEYYYAHLDAYAPGLAEGAVISRGAILGTVGASGDADARAPHLHFEVHRMAPGEHWWQGTSVDPFPLMGGTQPG